MTRMFAPGPLGSPPRNAACRQERLKPDVCDLIHLAQASEDLRLRIWDSRIGLAAPACEFVGHNNIITCCDVASRGADVYFASSSNGFDGAGCEVMIWDRRLASKPLHSCLGHTETVSGCCFIENGGSQLVASVSADGSMRLWNTNSGKCESVSALPANKRTMCCAPRFASESRAADSAAQLATGCVEGSLYQWNVECESSGGTTAVRVQPRAADTAVTNDAKSASKVQDATASYSSTAAAAAIGR